MKAVRSRTVARLSLAVGRIIVTLTPTACANVPPPDATTVPYVDLTRYAGTWYEMARLPLWFQRHCIDSKATYTYRNGTIHVNNECVTTSGELETAQGVATVVDTRTNARLNVVFDNWFSRTFGSSYHGNYWILHLDPDYRTAIVGTPDHRHVWILARTPHLDEPTYQQLVGIAQRLGYRTEDLIRDRRTSS
jgi:apolipoprotein D and lipocalin family protein